MTTYTKILRAGRVERITILDVGRRTARVLVQADGYPDRETRVLLGSIPPEVLAEAKELNR
jgi:hypothetical protein